VLAGFIRLLSGVRRIRAEDLPVGPTVFFANHSSHLDFAVIWAALPDHQRAITRPVAGRDYWEKTALRRWLAQKVFHAVLIERQKVTVAANPLEAMLTALDGGSSLIVFPEGTRSLDGLVHEFKAGLYHLARGRPAIPLVPTCLDNLNRLLPKGEFIAVPLIASVKMTAPIHLEAGEAKPAFLARAREALLGLTNR
ncbi:MAG: lysophospholipid acyltransferase family protein, partial [Opitutaceae bacterium]